MSEFNITEWVQPFFATIKLNSVAAKKEVIKPGDYFTEKVHIHGAAKNLFQIFLFIMDKDGMVREYTDVFNDKRSGDYIECLFKGFIEDFNNQK